jgi:hypothetical protein
MNYFLNLVDPWRWRKFVGGASGVSGETDTWGFNKRSHVKPGDRLICLLTERQMWCGVFEVEGDPIAADDPRSEAHVDFPVRFPVKALVTLSAERAISVFDESVWPFLSCTKSIKPRAPHWNTRAGLRVDLARITSEDGAFLLGSLLARQRQAPTIDAASLSAFEQTSVVRVTSATEVDGGDLGGVLDTASPQAAVPIAAPKTWVFQANPKQFRISEFLETQPADFLWMARQRVGDMAVGDRVFVWRAIGGGDPALSGVIAVAEIADLPRVQADDAASRPFWTSAASGDPALAEMRVRLNLLHVADEIIQRDTLLGDSVLSTMQVLTARTGTNFLLTPEHAAALRALWDGTTEIERDVADLRADTQIDETSRKALIDARRGQGKFREKLMRRWGGSCAVSGITVMQVLRASHAKPWRESTNTERLDPANGLLLAAHLDALFDAGLISFDDGGAMLVSSQVSAADRKVLGVPKGLRLPLDRREKDFMAIHRGTKLRNSRE